MALVGGAVEEAILCLISNCVISLLIKNRLCFSLLLAFIFIWIAAFSFLDMRSVVTSFEPCDKGIIRDLYQTGGNIINELGFFEKKLIYFK